jgi:hypothetical protein
MPEPVLDRILSQHHPCIIIIIIIIIFGCCQARKKGKGVPLHAMEAHGGEEV